MQRIAIIALAGLALAAAGCTKQDQRETSADARQAGARIKDDVRDAANSPEVKQLGHQIKEAAGDVAQVTKEAAKGAAKGAREGAAKVESESHDTGDEAKDR
jgi:hypothetical protein